MNIMYKLMKRKTVWAAALALCAALGIHLSPTVSDALTNLGTTVFSALDEPVEVEKVSVPEKPTDTRNVSEKPTKDSVQKDMVHDSTKTKAPEKNKERDSEEIEIPEPYIRGFGDK